MGSRPHKWEDHRLVLRYRRSSAFLPQIFLFQHFQIAIRSGRHNCNSIGKTNTLFPYHYHRSLNPRQNYLLIVLTLHSSYFQSVNKITDKRQEIHRQPVHVNNNNNNLAILLQVTISASMKIKFFFDIGLMVKSTTFCTKKLL